MNTTDTAPEAPRAYEISWDLTESHSTTVTPAELAELLDITLDELMATDLEDLDTEKLADELAAEEGNDTFAGVTLRSGIEIEPSDLEIVPRPDEDESSSGDVVTTVTPPPAQEARNVLGHVVAALWEPYDAHGPDDLMEPDYAEAVVRTLFDVYPTTPTALGPLARHFTSDEVEILLQTAADMAAGTDPGDLPGHLLGLLDKLAGHMRPELGPASEV